MACPSVLNNILESKIPYYPPHIVCRKVCFQVCLSVILSVHGGPYMTTHGPIHLAPLVHTYFLPHGPMLFKLVHLGLPDLFKIVHYVDHIYWQAGSRSLTERVSYIKQSV